MITNEEIRIQEDLQDARLAVAIVLDRHADLLLRDQYEQLLAAWRLLLEISLKLIEPEQVI